MADFRVRTPAIDPTAFANVLQRKQQMENEQQRYEQERKDNRLKRITDAIMAGQNIASNMLTIADKRGELKKKQSEAEGRQQLQELFLEPDTLPESNPLKEQMDPMFKADRDKRFMEAIIKSGLPVEKLLEMRSPKKTGGKYNTTLEMENGDLIPVIVDNDSGNALAVTGPYAGQIIPKEVAQTAVRGYSGTVTEDLEGRKGIVTKGGKFKGVLGEGKAPKEGKETRIQFTPEERKVVLDSRRAFNEDEYTKKALPLLKTLEKTRELVEKNPQGNIGPIQTDAARLIAGEVARLTDDDIVRNIPTQDFDEALKQWFKKRTDSNLSKVSKERYIQLLDIVQKKYSDSLDQSLNDIVEDTASFGTLNANKEVLKSTIGRGATPFIDRYKTKEVFDSLESIKKASTEELKKRFEKLKAGNK